MSSPPATLEPKKRQRHLLDDTFARLRMQSGLSVQPQQNVEDSTPTTNSAQGSGFPSRAEPGTATDLESLNPAKQAVYDSDLAIGINRRSCTQGTRVGVFTQLNGWLSNSASPPICWMSGMAGTGKTTIAYTFCERANKRKLLGASFFFTRSSADCRRMTRVVPTIAYQLAQFSTRYRSALSKALGQNADIGSKHVLTQFEVLLKEPLQDMKDAIADHLLVVIDGLEECEDRNGVGRIIDTLCQCAEGVPLKFLITSRPDPEIYAKLSLHRQLREVVHLDEIEESVVQTDIELYLKEELEFLFLGSFEMEQLVQRSGIFFIYAATLVRYIASGKRNVDPRKRLYAILEVAPDATQWRSPVDALYTVVMKTALEAGKPEDIWNVLRTVLLAHEPVNITTIVALAGIDDPQRVSSALSLLGSVLNPPGVTGLVSTLHASFPDYIFDNKRSGPYFCDLGEVNHGMAQRCFSIMTKQLCFNICDLETSFIPDTQIKDVQARINNMIPSSLAYACRYWANYVGFSHKSDDLLATLDEFLSDRLLFWIEVLNLRREMIMGVEGLLKTKDWLNKIGHGSSNSMILVEDARNFVTGFAASPASLSTPHIYISSLTFCPRSSTVHSNYWKRTRGVLVLNGSLMEQREAAALATWSLSSNILSIACAASGDRVAVGCFDRTVRILDSFDGAELVAPLRGHTEIPHSVAFSPDGQLVASGSYDGTIRIWNADNGTPICVALSHELEGHICYVNSVSFSPDSRRIASGSAAGAVRVWDINDGSLLLGPMEGHDDWIRAVAFSPDGALIASGSDDKTVRLWHSNKGTPASSPFVGHTHWVMSIAFSPDSTRIASGSRDHTVRVWNTSDGSLVSSPFEGHTGPVYSVVISPDGTRVASGSSDGTIRVWNIYDGTLCTKPFKLIDYTGSVLLITSVAFSSDGTRVISSSYNRAIHIWDVRYGDDMPSSPSSFSPITIPTITSLAFSPDGTRVLSSSLDNLIRLWHTRDGTFTIGPDQGQLPSSSISPFSPTYSPDGSYFAGAFENGVLCIMSAATGSVVLGLAGVDNHPPSAYRFSPSSKAVIAGYRNGTVRVWDLKTGQTTGCSFIGHTGGVTAIAKSLDCSLLASYSGKDKTLRVWDMLSPILDIDDRASSSPHSASDPNDKNEWHVTKDGWVVSTNGNLLFWLPADIAPIWRSPYASLIVTEYGTLQILKQKLIVGAQWPKIFIR
ncbi:WD40-repeat-containing domain protein [Rhizoctonia solani]|nr:WD40-repeat-containing domain protein [Rhizoctonia solani]